MSESEKIRLLLSSGQHVETQEDNSSDEEYLPHKPMPDSSLADGTFVMEKATNDNEEGRYEMSNRHLIKPTRL